MPVRALIIAIENYDKLTENPIRVFPGAVQAAEDFRAWLQSAHGAKDADIFFCSQPAIAGGRGASYAEIQAAIQDLLQVGRNGDTEKLFIYFSGHGFSRLGLGRNFGATALLPSDYQDRGRSRNLPIDFEDLRLALSRGLGWGHHYHFIDACRTGVEENKFNANSIVGVEEPHHSGEALTHTLFSASKGDAAKASSGFPEALLDGLRGRGRAKTWLSRPRRLAVRFDSLATYVGQRLTKQNIDADGGDQREDLIHELRPIPRYRCLVRVIGAQADDAFTLRVLDEDAETEIAKKSFTGPTTEFEREPRDYVVKLEAAPSNGVVPDVLEVDLYEEASVKFQLTAAGSVKTRGGRDDGPKSKGLVDTPPLGELSIEIGAEFEDVTVRGLDGKFEKKVSKGENAIAVPHGRYSITTADPEKWRDDLKQTVRVGPQQPATVKVEAKVSSVRREIVEAVGKFGSTYGGRIDFSETLGPIANDDLGLWLAILGGSAIVKEPGRDFSKLRGLGLASFEEMKAGKSAIYVVSGLDDFREPIRFGTSTPSEPAKVRWQGELRQIGMLPNVQHLQASSETGAQFVTLALGKQSRLTVSTACLPNRVTLLTLHFDQRGEIALQQVILPAGHLLKHLPREVREQIVLQAPLRELKFMAEAQRLFRLRREVGLQSESKEVLKNLLYGKWMDPIMACLASYELLRRGQRSGLLREAVANLQRHFPELPDVGALARLAGEKNAVISGTPLFADGLPALPEKDLPFALAKLDRANSWSLWRGVVR